MPSEDSLPISFLVKGKRSVPAKKLLTPPIYKTVHLLLPHTPPQSKRERERDEGDIQGNYGGNLGNGSEPCHSGRPNLGATS